MFVRHCFKMLSVPSDSEKKLAVQSYSIRIGTPPAECVLKLSIHPNPPWRHVLPHTTAVALILREATKVECFRSAQWKQCVGKYSNTCNQTCIISHFRLQIDWQSWQDFCLDHSQHVFRPLYISFVFCCATPFWIPHLTHLIVVPRRTRHHKQRSPPVSCGMWVDKKAD